MSYPAYFTKFAGPFGLLALAGAGYLVYRIGKEKGKSAKNDNSGEGLADSAIKGAMGTAYKAWMGMETVLKEKKKHFSEMWAEAKEEIGEK